ncbi:hypothetical protein B9Z19DRAFT_1118431 [Tuber borchii]|uniref:Uncharacterized protein n=1 Tax=Tuber borchii TaxID=42251 RepID=A0A2T7A8Q7_TUBBO|nr:hypothetical protein B9Z19DRAFT_1118431 [Tuber borchii]
MGGIAIANPSSPPTKLYVSHTPLQNAAVTINALANSEYLTHFPGIAPEDVSYANQIVQGLPSNICSSTHTFAFSTSTPMSLASSFEFTAYAALQNEVTAGAILRHWKIVKASRELNTPSPIVKGAGDCTKVWDALEKCWGRKVAEDAWFDYINGDKKEVGDSGDGESGGRKECADSGGSGNPGERPWKRTRPSLVANYNAVDRSGENENPREKSREQASPDSTPIDGVVGNSGGSEGPGEKSGKRVGLGQTPSTSAGSSPSAPPYTSGQRPHSLGRTFRAAYPMRYTDPIRSRSYPETAGAGPVGDPLELEDM